MGTGNSASTGRVGRPRKSQGDTAARAIENAVEVGARLFAERGYGSTTTRDLARALGVTNGTFYHYFPTKEDLLYRICREAIERLIAAVAEATSDMPPSRGKVESMIVAHTKALLANDALQATGMTELRSLSGENRAAVFALREEYRAEVEAVLGEAQQHGVIRSDIAPRTLRITLLNMTNWTNRYTPDRDPPVDELGLTLAQVFLDGTEHRRRSD